MAIAECSSLDASPHRSRRKKRRPQLGGLSRILPCSCYFILLACLLSGRSHAYVYFDNNAYLSLPASFGRFIRDGKPYSARLQYFHDDPFLCNQDEETFSKFVTPSAIYDEERNYTVPAEPVAILVSRGNCAFQRKASVAEMIDESVEFLIVYNVNLDGSSEAEDMLVPMRSEYGTTRLVLLSISHKTGQAIKKFLSEQPDTVTELGGPIIQLDFEQPVDFLSMMLSAFGLFFMLVSCAGCVAVLASTYAQITHSEDPIAAVTMRRLLTEEEVHQLAADTSHIACANNSSESASLPDDSENEAHQCAVCIYDFDSEKEITALPCQHLFHTECILPWLTERQSKCPLCKFDVLQHFREQQQPSLDLQLNVSIWDRILRYRWIHVDDHDESESSRLASVERGGDGVELTEQRVQP